MNISDILKLTKIRISLANCLSAISGFAIAGGEVISIRSAILFLGIFF